MHSVDTAREAMALLHAGASITEVAQRCGVNRSTVRAWRDQPDRALERPSHCPVCGRGDLDEPAYAYLLGLYLGDGTISRQPKDVWRLRIFQDQRYVVLIEHCDDAMRAVLPNKVGRTKKVGCIELGSSSKHWPCLFPQAGPGLKHTRPIRLADWQRTIVEAHPEQLLRGLIHSDGCRSINRVCTGGKWYAYPRARRALDTAHRAPGRGISFR